MTVVSSERRRFQMHPHLLMDVMRRQAGTLGKAILEGGMNAVDAKAKKFSVELTQKGMVLEDDGQGFPSAEEVQQFFEVFGKPHEESEAKTYGTFRMGRGQIFAFGKNVWRSQCQQMVVDLENMGLDYDLEQLAESERVPGCRITVTFYNPLSPSALEETKRELKHLAKYIQVDFRLNGTKYAVDPKTEEWDVADNDIYLRLRDGGTLQVYNLGVLVRDFPASHYATGGVVVSRKPLKVNFARNDIQHDCPIWKRVQREIRSRADVKNEKAEVLTPEARNNYVQRLLAGDLAVSDPKIITRRIFQDATGRYWSWKQLQHVPRDLSQYSEAPLGSREADRVMQMKLGFVFSKNMLDAFELPTAKRLIDVINGSLGSRHSYMAVASWTWVPFAKLEAKLGKTDHVVIPETQWSPTERAALNLLSCALSRHLYSWGDGKPVRKLVLGSSRVADGWTDGNSYIAVGREYLRRHRLDLHGILALATLLVHEVCHDDDDTNTSVHGEEFYQRYHDLTQKVLPDMLVSMFRQLPTVLAKEKLILKKEQLKDYDNLHAAAQAAAMLGSALNAAVAATVPGLNASTT